MIRNIACALILTIVFQVIPPSVLASELDLTAFCPLDGSISSNVSTLAVADVVNQDQPLVLQFTVSNDSETFSYGGVEIGIALYQNQTATTPVFWAPVSRGAEFLPKMSQNFEALLDVSAVPAGEYSIKVGVAQGDQLAALVSSRQADAVAFTKTTTGTDYTAALTTTNRDAAVGDVIEYTLTTQNNTDVVQRDFDQHIVIAQGETPRGSAIGNSLFETVRILPGGTEVTDLSTRLQTKGTYTVFGYFTKDNTLLPVVTDQFTIDTETEPTHAFISGVGVEGLDQTGDELSVVSCVASVTGQPFDIVQLEQQVMTGETVVDSTVVEVAENGFAQTTIPKESLSEFTLLSNLYVQPNQASDRRDAEIATGEVQLGQLAQSVAQTHTCGVDCQVDTIAETLEAFVAEDTFQTTVWFYLGIIAAAMLLLFLMLGRLTPRGEDKEPMHEPQ